LPSCDYSASNVEPLCAQVPLFRAFRSFQQAIMNDPTWPWSGPVKE